MSGVLVTREMRALLESDLYHEADRPGPPYAMAYESPLRWRVEWAITRRTDETPGPGVRVIARIVDPRGKEYARSEDATLEWLEATLP